jgi:hypothetical protein
MASIIYTPSHDVSLPDEGQDPLFGAQTATATVTVTNTGNAPGNVQFYISPDRRASRGGRIDRKTVEGGESVDLTASYQFEASIGLKNAWAVVTDDATPHNEIDAHRFLLTISQRQAKLAVQGHISINVG